MTYETILRQVWSSRTTGDANLVRNFMKKLRAKLGEDAANPSWFLNVRGSLSYAGVSGQRAIGRCGRPTGRSNSRSGMPQTRNLNEPLRSPPHQ